MGFELFELFELFDGGEIRVDLLNPLNPCSNAVSSAATGSRFDAKAHVIF